MGARAPVAEVVDRPVGVQGFEAEYFGQACRAHDRQVKNSGGGYPSAQPCPRICNPVMKSLRRG